MININQKQICVFVQRPSLFPFRGGKTSALSSECYNDQDHFTDWMSFLSSNLE